MYSADWLARESVREVVPIEKATDDTAAWFATIDGRESFVKFFPTELAEIRATVEIAIAGGNLHPAIVPLRQTVPCADGVLLVYDRVKGENVARSRKEFQRLPLNRRIHAVTTAFAALAAITDAGFMVVDWYEGNMLYDFGEHRTWLFDWELCRAGDGFTLEMDHNYGSARMMAPEEFLRGSWLDGRTLVFNRGRYALLTLPELAEPLAPLLARATHPSRAARYGSVREFVTAWDAALATLSEGIA